MSERLITDLPLIGRLIKSRGERQASPFTLIFVTPPSTEYLPGDRPDSIADDDRRIRLIERVDASFFLLALCTQTFRIRYLRVDEREKRGSLED